MQLADAVGDVRQADGQHGHAERFVVVARVLPAQAQELLPVDLQRRQVRAEIMLDELRREDVVAGRHGRVRGEAGAGGDGLAGRGEVELLLLHHHAECVPGRKTPSGPSFMWQTVGVLPSARRARMPPMPRTISWRMRMS